METENINADNGDILNDIIEENLKRFTEVIDSVGFSHNPKWLDGYELLCCAVKHQSQSIINYLLEKNVKVNCDAKKKFHNTPLHLAVINGDSDSVKKLLAKGASIIKENRMRENPFDIAFEFINQSNYILKLLINHISEDNITDEVYLKLLKDLVDLDLGLLAEDLLKKCLNIDINCLRNFSNYLWIAVKKGFLNTVKLMLARGVDVNFTVNFTDILGKCQQTALHFACRNDNNTMVKLLLEYGASDSFDKQSYVEKRFPIMNPLQTAISYGNLNVVKTFLDYGVDVNCQLPFQEGRTSLLHIACKYDKIEIIEFLLSRGANINIKNNEGFPPIVECVYNDSFAFNILTGKEKFVLNFKTAKHIITECFEFNPKSIIPIMKYIDTFCSQKFQNEIDQKIINSQDCETLLNYTIQYHNEIDKGIVTLVRYGVDVNLTNQRGRTAIYVAILKQDKSSINKLLKYGANLNVKCNNGYTPIDYLLINELCEEHYDTDIDIINYDKKLKCKKFIDFIFQFMLKMKLLNFNVNEENYKVLMGMANDLFRHQKKYKKEIEKMRATIINNDVTYYNIVGADQYKLMMYLQDDVIFEALKSESYQSQFPEFSIIISGCFQRALIRKNLLDKLFHYTIFDNIRKLPYLCMRNIFNNFTNLDLRNAFYKYSMLNPNKKSQ